jgi:predicted nucleic acid-binding protein
LSLRVFLDANVLFIAAYSPEGLAHLLFELGRLDLISLLGSGHVLEGARTNLGLKKPSALEELDSIAGTLELIAIPARRIGRLNLPADDALVFAAAVAGRATHLLTGDRRHFGPWFNKPDATAGLQIQTVRDFFDQRFGL